MIAQRPQAAREVDAAPGIAPDCGRAARGPRRYRDRHRRDQVAQRISDDQPPDTDDSKQDAAGRAADQPHDAVARREQRVGAGQQRPGADNGRYPGLYGWREQHAPGTLSGERGVDHPEPPWRKAEQQRADSATAH
ncbi:MAG TPA: hypothetical protein VJT16_15905 [Streptosporangiaceae bacterium]|nr:hypothetical protein [Streptosporangiaceae bacterium]